LQQDRPLFSVDGEPARPLRALADIARVAAALEEAAQAPSLVWDGLGLAIDQIPRDVANLQGEIRFGTLVRTLGAHLVLDEKATLAPIGPLQIQQLQKHDLREPAAEKIRARLGDRPGAARWIERWFKDPLDGSRPGALLIRLVR